MKALVVWSLAGLVALAGCGGGQTQGAAFDSLWSNDNGAGIGAFQQQFAARKIPRGVDVAVGIVGDRTILGVLLDGGGTWSAERALDSRPTVVGTVVVGMGGGELFALDARTGKLLWARRAGGQLRGAGDDGEITVASIQPTTGRGSIVLAVTRDGAVVRQIEDEADIGVPAVVDRVAFLPWQGQYVSVYDLDGGDESARVLLRSQTSHAFAVGGALFFGERGVTRFDDKIRLAPTGKASTVSLPARELPASPRWKRPGTEVTPLKTTAFDNIRTYARPAANGPGFEGGHFAATYYRIAVGLDAQTGAVAWAHTHDAELIAGAAYAGGFALCDAAGKVTFLDGATGAHAGAVSFGKPVVACVVQADGMRAPRPVAADRGPAGKSSRLAAQLAKAVRMPESEHVAIQRLLLRELAALEDEIATSTLIDLASSPDTASLLLEDARKALATRRSGVDLMLSALDRKYDFLTGVLRPPPVAPLADALAALQEKRAARLLAAHLNDPASTLEDVEHAAAALAVLADKSELPQLATFFAHYRCAADEEPMGNAVVSTARGLVKIGAADLVSEAAEDPLTSMAVKTRLEDLVRPLGKGKAQAATPKAATPKAASPKAATPKAAMP